MKNIVKTYENKYRFLLSVELSVRLPQPTQRWFILTVEAVVEVDESIVILDVLVKGVLQISGNDKAT